MKHLFVPYDIAVKLEQNGFNEKCLGAYRWGTFYFIEVHATNEDLKVTSATGTVAAPMWQQAVDWLRENGAFVCVELGEILYIAFVKYKGEIHWIGDNIYSIKCYDTYYSALQSVIEKALDLINH